MARVTVYDVAEKAGVSTATVSFAFRHPDKVKDDTKAKVLRVAEELGYVPSGNARSLAKGRTGTLGMYAFDMLLEKPQGSGLEEDRSDVSSMPASMSDDDEPDVLTYPLYVVDKVLDDFRNNGTLSKLSEKWYGEDVFKLPGADKVDSVIYWK